MRARIYSVGMILIVACFFMQGADASIISEIEPNDSFGAAQNVDSFFSMDFNTNVTNSTTRPWVSIAGTGNGTWDYFSFTVPHAGAYGLFDIDYGMNDLDSWLNLFGPDGTHLVAHDDGWAGDPGSVHGYDGYFGYTFNSPGLYRIAVGRYAGGPLSPGQDYVLQLSIQDHAVGATVPEPATLGLLGIGLLGLVRRKFFKRSV